MKKAGHVATGMGAGLAVGGLVLASVPANPVLAAIAFFAAVSGSTAPDWLEISWAVPKKDGSFYRKSLIPHRTITHWWPLWIGLLSASILNLSSMPSAWVGLAFAIGGLTHLICDVPNPMGIPLVTPFGKRFTLNLWKSGQMEWLLGPLFLALGGFALKALVF